MSKIFACIGRKFLGYKSDFQCKKGQSSCPFQWFIPVINDSCMSIIAVLNYSAVLLSTDS